MREGGGRKEFGGGAAAEETDEQEEKDRKATLNHLRDERTMMSHFQFIVFAECK